MLNHKFSLGALASIALAGLTNAHIAVFHKSMWCLNGTDPNGNPNNNNLPCHPLFNLTYADYWMHAFDGCTNFPPAPGDFLELQAGGSFTVELADNRAVTSLNPNAKLTDWGDGKVHPDDYSMQDLGGLKPSGSHCIPSPNLHTQNQSMAAGTAFAISYNSELSEVTPDNLVVFTTRYNTPWKRVVTYDVPASMPACPDAGCICTYVWIPNGCGQPNMYMFPYRCKVIPDSTPPKTIGAPKPAVWCEDDPSKCVKGPKQMLIWNQQERNNIEVEGYDLHGSHKSPAYNAKCGWSDGAQNDIFVESGYASGPIGGSGSGGSNSTTGSGTSSLPTSTPTSSLPSATGVRLASAPGSSPTDGGSGSATTSNPGASPTDGGASAAPTSDPGASPTDGGASAAPTSDPGASPTDGGASSAPTSDPGASPTDGGASSAPTSDPGASPTDGGAGSAPTSAPAAASPSGGSGGTTGTCTKRPPAAASGSGSPSALPKRMKLHRRDKHNNIF